MRRWSSPVPDPGAMFLAACEPPRAIAKDRQFPAFTVGPGNETTLNSAPYLYALSDFHAAFAGDPARAEILGDLGQGLAYLEKAGVEWRAMLVGGSFVRDRKTPSDLDGLLIYQVRGDAEAAARALGDFARHTRLLKVDLKLCPADCDPAIFMKRLLFFSYLFAFDKSSEQLVHGSVLVVPDREESGA